MGFSFPSFRALLLARRCHLFLLQGEGDIVPSHALVL